MKPKDIPEYTFAHEQDIIQPIIREVKGPSAEYVSLGFRFPGAATDDKASRPLRSRSTVLSVAFNRSMVPSCFQR